MSNSPGQMKGHGIKRADIVDAADTPVVKGEGTNLAQTLRLMNSGTIQTDGISTRDFMKWATTGQNSDGTVPVTKQRSSRSQSFSVGSRTEKRSPASRRASESNKHDKERIAARLARWGDSNNNNSAGDSTSGRRPSTVATKKNSVRTVCEPEPEQVSFDKKQKSSSMRKGSTSTTVASTAVVNASPRRRDSFKALFSSSHKQEEVEKPMSQKEQAKYAEMSPSTKYVWDYSRRRSSGASSANLSVLPSTGVAYGATAVGNLMQAADGVILSAQGSAASPLKKLFSRGRTCPTFADSLAEVSPEIRDEDRLVDFNFSFDSMLIRAEALAERSWKRLGMKKTVDKDKAVFSVTVELPQVEEFDSCMGRYGLSTVFGQPSYRRTFDNESKWVVQNISEGRCIVRVWHHPNSNPFQKHELGIGAFDYTAERVGSKQVLSVPILSNDGKSENVGVVEVCLSDMSTKDKTDECHTNFEGEDAQLFTDLYPHDSVSQLFHRRKSKKTRKTHFDRLMPSVVHAHCFAPLKPVVKTVQNSIDRSPSCKLDEQGASSPAAAASASASASVTKSSGSKANVQLSGNSVRQQVAKFEQKPHSVASPKQKLSWKPGANAAASSAGLHRSHSVDVSSTDKKTIGLSLPFIGRKFGDEVPDMLSFGRQIADDSHTLSLSPSSSLPLSQVPSPSAANRCSATSCTELTDDFLSMPGNL